VVGFSSNSVGYLEIFACVLWLASLALETVADTQLTKWKVSNRTDKTGVCQVGLWKYSRHPNYFFEFMIWISYVIYAISSLNFSKVWLVLQLALVPPLAYYFLVHFTGIWMAEQSSLKKRGEKYAQYQNTVSPFFLWFPKKPKEQ